MATRQIAKRTVGAFHGYFDNAADLAAELAAPTADLALLYGLAVERWGDERRRVIGEYCAIIADAEGKHVRLSRSPLRAPPLVLFSTTTSWQPPPPFPAHYLLRVSNDVSTKFTSLTARSSISRTRKPSWFEDIHRVPLGAVVDIRRGNERALRKPYDLFDLPDVRMDSDADYIARAGELLDEGIRACLTGSRRPGATLSGGLDLSQVAVRTLAQLAPWSELPTFTFHPEPGFDGLVRAWEAWRRTANG